MMKTNQILCATAIIVATLISSCSKHSEVLETIPATSSFVARIDLDKVADAFDVKISDDDVKFPDSWTKTIGRKIAENKDAMIELSNSIDRRNIYMFNYETRYNILTVELTDPSAFNELLSENLDNKNSKNGYTIYSVNGSTILTRDSQAWHVDVSNPNSALEIIKDVLNQAEKKSIADFDNAVQALGGDAMSDVVTIIPRSSCFYHAEIETKDNSLEINANLIGDKAAIDSLKSTYILQPIGDKLGIEAPDGALLVAAMGIKNDYDWAGTIDRLGGAIPFDAVALLQSAVPVLKSIEGTVYLTISSANIKSLIDSPAPSLSISLRAMAKQGAIQLLKTYFSDMLGSMMVKGVQQGDNIVFNTDLFKAIVGNDGDILRIDFATPSAPTSGTTKSYTGKFEKYDGAIEMNIPSLAEATDGKMPFGLNVVGNGSIDKASLKITLTGTSGKFFPTIYSAIND